MVYDANVLHPASLRDLLIRLACTGLYRARWTATILDEMVTSVIRANPELDRARIVRTRHLMIEAVPDCLVTGYEPLVEAIELPDQDDRHVAAAIRCNAEVIVTNNLRDFPTKPSASSASKRKAPICSSDTYSRSHSMKWSAPSGDKPRRSANRQGATTKFSTA